MRKYVRSLCMSVCRIGFLLVSMGAVPSAIRFPTAQHRNNIHHVQRVELPVCNFRNHAHVDEHIKGAKPDREGCPTRRALVRGVRNRHIPIAQAQQCQARSLCATSAGCACPVHRFFLESSAGRSSLRRRTMTRTRKLQGVYGTHTNMPKLISCAMAWQIVWCY